jgi:hypothetical protein
VTTLAEARSFLAGALEGVLEEVATVHETVPDAITPPCVVIQAGDPYLAPGDVFGEWAATFDLFLCVDLVSNAQAIEDLDPVLLAVLEALEDTAYGVDTVGRPGPVHTAEWMAHAITVTVSCFVTLT